MDQISQIDNWRIPEWHSDLQHCNVELSTLKSISTELVTRIPTLQVELRLLESGYINVDILLGTTKIGEIWIVHRESPTFGVFLGDGNSEEEFYFDEAAKAVNFLNARLS